MAGFHKHSKTIAGSLFTVTPLDFHQGKEGLMKLIAVIAPAVGAALAGGKGGVMAVIGEPRLAALLGDALATLPSKLDNATLEWFEEAFGARSTAEVGSLAVTLKLDNKAMRASAFEALGYMAFFEWLAFCLEVNYSGFFGAASARMPKKAPPAAATP